MPWGSPSGSAVGTSTIGGVVPFASTSSLRPALHLALAVAREGQRQQPVIAAPTRLRPYLDFVKLPAAALEACRRVVEQDDSFRQRVALHATVDQVGSLGFLWLTRPESWEATAATLHAEHERDRSRTSAVRRQSELEGREEQARLAVQQSETERRALLGALDAAQAEVANQQRQLRELHSALDAARASLGLGEDQRRDLLHKLKAAEAQVATHVEQNRGLRRERDSLALRAVESEAVAAPAQPPGSSEASRRDLADEGRFRDALGEAAVAAAAVVQALERVASAWPVEDEAEGSAPVESALGNRPMSARTAAGRSAPAGRAPVRRPVPIPAGMFDDTTATAEYLVRLADVRLLIDGYNVSKQGWPDLTLALQRRRLLDVLVSLQARTGARPEVVFDGVDTDEVAHRELPHRLLVQFTGSGVEADDRLLEMIGQVPQSHPVVVVSSDRRVREGARQRGANLLHAAQLLALLR